MANNLKLNIYTKYKNPVTKFFITLHGSGIRACYKIVGISPKITPRQKKGKKVWIFCVYAPETKEILAVTMDKRTKKQLRNLMTQLKCLDIEIEFYCTDAFKSFKEVLPYYQYIIGKSFTKGINILIRSKIARFH